MTTEEKCIVYEQVLHDIQLFSSVIMDVNKMQKLISMIGSWSYAHRCGNGALTEEEQNEMIEYEFKRLKNREYTK